MNGMEDTYFEPSKIEDFISKVKKVKENVDTYLRTDFKKNVVQPVSTAWAGPVAVSFMTDLKNENDGLYNSIYDTLKSVVVAVAEAGDAAAIASQSTKRFDKSFSDKAGEVSINEIVDELDGKVGLINAGQTNTALTTSLSSIYDDAYTAVSGLLNDVDSLGFSNSSIISQLRSSLSTIAGFLKKASDSLESDTQDSIATAGGNYVDSVSIIKKAFTVATD